MALSGIAPPAACVARNRSLFEQIVHFEGDLLRRTILRVLRRGAGHGHQEEA